MKKTVFAVLAGILLFFAVSCGKTEEVPATRSPEEAPSEALFELKGFAEKEGETRFFAAGEGFFFVTPTAAGVSCGYFDPEARLLQEQLLQLPDVSAGAVEAFSLGEGKELVAAGGRVIVLDLATGAKKESASEKFSPDGAILYQKMALIAPSDGRLLLAPPDLSEIYVAGELSGLPGFARLLSASEAGDEIYYACGAETGFEGLYATPYGKTEPKKLLEIEFAGVQTLADGVFLFTSYREDQVIYTYYSVLTGEEKTIELNVRDAYDKAVCSADGARFFGVRGGGMEILAFGGKSGVSLGGFSTAGLDKRPFSALALSPDGKTLVFSAGDPETKNETVGVLRVEEYLK